MKLPTALLDVNLLVALFDPDHIHHDVAHDWFADHHVGGWATCPLTENGFVRVVSNPRYAASRGSATDLVGRLRQFCESKHHEFWPASVTLRDETLFTSSVIRGHQQWTDIYLLGLAVSRHGCLATLDRTIPFGAVAGASTKHLHVIAPASD